MTDIEVRIQRLEDLEAIRDLAVRYGFAVDERDFDAIVALFSPDGCLRTNAGVIKGQGVEGVGAYFRNHLPNLGPSNHFVHGHIVDFGEDADRATGVVSAHAEMWRMGAPMPRRAAGRRCRRGGLRSREVRHLRKAASLSSCLGIGDWIRVVLARCRSPFSRQSGLTKENRHRASTGASPRCSAQSENETILSIIDFSIV